MPTEAIDRSLDGIVLPDGRTSEDVDLGRLGRSLVTLIRHRY